LSIKKKKTWSVFQNTTSDLSTLMAKVKLNSYLWLKSKQGLFSYSYHDWCCEFEITSI